MELNMIVQGKLRAKFYQKEPRSSHKSPMHLNELPASTL